MKAALLTFIGFLFLATAGAEATIVSVPRRPLSSRDSLDWHLQGADAVVLATVVGRETRTARMGGGCRPVEETHPEYAVIAPRRSLLGPPLPARLPVRVWNGAWIAGFEPRSLPVGRSALLALHRRRDGSWEAITPNLPYASRLLWTLGADSAAAIAEVESALRGRTPDSLAANADVIALVRPKGPTFTVERAIVGTIPPSVTAVFRALPYSREGSEQLLFASLDGSGCLEPLRMGAGEMDVVHGIVWPLNQPLESVILQVRMVRAAHGHDAPRPTRH